MILKTNGACLITFFVFERASSSLKRDDFGFGGVQQHVDECDKQRSVTCRAASIEISHKIGVGREMEGGGGASRSSVATFITQALSTRL